MSTSQQIGVMGFVIRHKDWKKAQILFGDDAEERAAKYMYRLDTEQWEESEGAQGDSPPTQAAWLRAYKSGNLENWELYEPAFVSSTERPVLDHEQAEMICSALRNWKEMIGIAILNVGGTDKSLDWKEVDDLVAYLEPFVKGHTVGDGSNGNGSDRRP